MKDEELLEWYKNNNKVKPENMTDKDYELNMNNALKVKQDQALDQTYEQSKKEIVQQQTNAQQSASISNEKLMKYLGQTQLASGTASGQKGSDFIKANNSYVANRAAITNDAAAQQADLLKSYQSEKLANETQAYNNQISILDKYRNREIEDKQLQQADEDRQREIEQWELEMDAYKQQLQQVIEDRNTAKEDKLKAEQESKDIAWLEIANERVNSLYLELMNDDGTLSSQARAKIKKVVDEYKSKFNNEDYYERLLELYKISTNSTN